MRPSLNHPRPDADAPADPALASVDTMLMRAASRLPVPSGLADRVFRASAPLLAAHQRPLVHPGSRRASAAPLTRTMKLMPWSRLSLAASVVLAFTIGVRWLHTASSLPSLAALSPDALLAVSRPIGPDDPLRELFSDGDAPGADAADDSYFESFGIFGTRVDDLLGDPAAFDDARGG
jgi:hypothetical protein